MWNFLLGFILATALWFSVMLELQNKVDAYEMLLSLSPLPHDVEY